MFPETDVKRGGVQFHLVMRIGLMIVLAVHWVRLPNSKPFYLCVAQSGRALGLEPRGRRFEPSFTDHIMIVK